MQPQTSGLVTRIRRSQLYSDGGLFVIRLILIYAFWKLFFYVSHRHDSPLYAPWQDFVIYLGSLYAQAMGRFMGGFEQFVSVHGNTVVLYRTYMEVAEHCLALPAMFVFTMSILLFRGIWWQKLLFIAAGIIGIILINLIRIFFVIEAFMRLSDYFYHMHHSLIYVVITYGFILLMIDWWMRHNAAPQK